MLDYHYHSPPSTCSPLAPPQHDHYHSPPSTTTSTSPPAAPLDYHYLSPPSTSTPLSSPTLDDHYLSPLSPLKYLLYLFQRHHLVQKNVNASSKASENAICFVLVSSFQNVKQMDHIQKSNAAKINVCAGVLINTELKWMTPGSYRRNLIVVVS